MILVRPCRARAQGEDLRQFADLRVRLVEFRRPLEHRIARQDRDLLRREPIGGDQVPLHPSGGDDHHGGLLAAMPHHVVDPGRLARLKGLRQVAMRQSPRLVDHRQLGFEILGIGEVDRLDAMRPQQSVVLGGRQAVRLEPSPDRLADQTPPGAGRGHQPPPARTRVPAIEGPGPIPGIVAGIGHQLHI